MRLYRPTLAWLLLTLAACAWLGWSLARQRAAVFLPGPSTDGHHQIEAACDLCHAPFAGVAQEACLECHAEELENAGDSHAAAVFSDPRNAADLARLDVRRCVTCHTEHQPEITGDMGVTLPVDFCVHCHADIGDERPTHLDLAPATCASGGCHNFHDNRNLHQDFLLDHGAANAATFDGLLPVREAWIAVDPGRRTPLSAGDADGPDAQPPELIDAWASSAHAAAGVACTDCHGGGLAWTDGPGLDICATCHETESTGFLAGRHGMRLPAGLEPMSPADARLPMRTEAAARTLHCSACHDAHDVDTRRAAVDACLECHADDHSTAYAESPHARAWRAEMAGDAPPGSGTSCASCHLPRTETRLGGDRRIVVQHNQNDNLRPNEKMLRDVCLACHSLAFSLDALADPELIRRNFAGRPERHVASVDMVLSLAEPDDPDNEEDP